MSRTRWTYSVSAQAHHQKMQAQGGWYLGWKEPTGYQLEFQHIGKKRPCPVHGEMDRCWKKSL